MAVEEKQSSHATPAEPRGFGEHTRGLPGEYAHEQGWGLNEEERRKTPQDADGGADYNYGARDFGDEPVNMERLGNGEQQMGGSMANDAAQREDESAKKHGDPMEGALKQMNGHGKDAGLEPAPRPDQGADAKPHAAPSGPRAKKERVGRQQR